MNGSSIEGAQTRTAIARLVRRRAWVEAEAVFTTVLGTAVFAVLGADWATVA